MVAVRRVEVGMQEGNNTTAVRLQTPAAGAVPVTNAASPSGANGNAGADMTALQVPASADTKSTLDMIKGMTMPDMLAGFALVVGIILVMRHFGWKRAGRAADENLAHLEQARLLAQAARYQAATDALGEGRTKPTHAGIGAAGPMHSIDARAGEGRASDDRLSRRFDEKIDRLERLITEADRRIRKLEDLEAESRSARMSIGPAAATPFSRTPSTPRETPTELPSRATSRDVSEPPKAESRLIEPRAEAPPDDWQSRTRQLAAAGLSPREIAFKLGKPIGHVELVLALQRGQIAG